MGIGVPVFELYGMTENTAIATANFPGRMKLGTVGEPYPGTEVRLDPRRTRSRRKHAGNFAGYWGKPDKTAETFTDDGFLMTGDVGEWVDGTHIRIVDRIKHIIITSGGKNISPSEIENALKTSPYVKEAMVVGDGRKYLTALVGIEFDTVGDWALRRNIPYTTYRDLSEKPEVVELIQGVVNDDQHEVRLGRADQEVPPDDQGARPRGRRVDRDAEDQAGGDRQGVRRAHRVDVLDGDGRGRDRPLDGLDRPGRASRHAAPRRSIGSSPRSGGASPRGRSTPSSPSDSCSCSRRRRAVNFAQGAIGLVTAWFFSMLLVDWDIPDAGSATTPTSSGSRRSSSPSPSPPASAWSSNG